MAPAELDVFDLDGTDIGDGALLAGEIMPEPSDYLSEVQRDGKPLGVASWGSGGVISSGSLLSWNFAVVPCTRSERPLHGQERLVVGLLDAADEPFLVTHLHDRASSDFG